MPFPKPQPIEPTPAKPGLSGTILTPRLSLSWRMFTPAPAPTYRPVTGCACAAAIGSASTVAARRAFLRLILSLLDPTASNAALPSREMRPIPAPRSADATIIRQARERGPDHWPADV